MNMQDLSEKLFAEGECLTAILDIDKEITNAARKAEQDFKQSNSDKLCLISYDFHNDLKKYLPRIYPDFQYFSNGALVICLPSEKSAEVVERARKFLAEFGHEIKQIYGPDTMEEWENYFKLIIDIKEKSRKLIGADKVSYQLKVFNTPEEFADFCFADNNVLLNAAKDRNFDPKYRKFLALFSNRKFVVCEDCKGYESFRGEEEVSLFKETVKKDFPAISPTYVPQRYIDALYEKAKEFDWYVSPEEAEKNMPKPSAEELQKMRDYAADILRNRECISITTPRILYRDIYLEATRTSPDCNRYILFDDGKLLLSEKFHNWKVVKNEPIVEDLQRCFPNLKFGIEKVPDTYITYLYEKISERQKSARDIYTDIMQKKAQLLRTISDLPLVLTQEIVAQFAGWHDFAEMYGCEEAQARHLICLENDLERRAEQMGYENSIYWNGLKYLDLLKKQNIPYEKGQDFFRKVGEKIKKSRAI